MNDFSADNAATVTLMPPKARPTFAELDAYPRCLIEHFTKHALEQNSAAIAKTEQLPYPLDSEYDYAQLNLRDLVLSMVDVQTLETALAVPSHPQHRAFKDCQKAFGLNKKPSERSSGRDITVPRGR